MHSHGACMRSPRGFLLPGGGLQWATLVQAVKDIIQKNDVDEEPTRPIIKGWIKSAEPAVALMGLTVVETLACNAPPKIRSQLAGPRWMTRFSKQLNKPPAQVVLIAQAQLMVDLAFLFSNEELGRASHALISQPQYKWLSDSLNPSTAAKDIKAEWQLGIPAVGPHRGPDYTMALRSTGHQPDVLRSMNTHPNISADCTQASNASMGSNSSSQYSPHSTCSGNVVSIANSSITAHGKYTNEQYQAMRQLVINHSKDLQLATSASRRALQSLSAPHLALDAQLALQSQNRQLPTQSSGAVTPALPPGLAGCIDKGYQAAERCNGWRQRIALLIPCLTDPVIVSQLLTAIDTANTALGDWQGFVSGGQMFKGLGLQGDLAASWRVPTNPSQAKTAATGHLLDLGDDLASSSPKVATMQAQNVKPATDIMDGLFGLSVTNNHPNVNATPSSNPFASIHSSQPATQYSTSSTVPTLQHQSSNNAYLQSSTVHRSQSAASVQSQQDSVQGSADAYVTYITHPGRLQTTGDSNSSPNPGRPPFQPSQIAAALPTQQPGPIDYSNGQTNSSVGFSANFPAVPSSGSQQLPNNNGNGYITSSLLPSPGLAMPSVSNSLSNTSVLATTAATAQLSMPAADIQTPPQLPWQHTGSSTNDTEMRQVDWQAELDTVLAKPVSGQRAQVSLKLEGDLRALISRMQQHYEASLAVTKQKAVAVVRQLKQEMTQQQQQQQTYQPVVQQSQSNPSQLPNSSVVVYVPAPPSPRLQQQVQGPVPQMLQHQLPSQPQVQPHAQAAAVWAPQQQLPYQAIGAGVLSAGGIQGLPSGGAQQTVATAVTARMQNGTQPMAGGSSFYAFEQEAFSWVGPSSVSSVAKQGGVQSYCKDEIAGHGPRYGMASGTPVMTMEARYPPIITQQHGNTIASSGTTLDLL